MWHTLDVALSLTDQASSPFCECSLGVFHQLYGSSYSSIVIKGLITNNMNFRKKKKRKREKEKKRGENLLVREDAIVSFDSLHRHIGYKLNTLLEYINYTKHVNAIFLRN